MTQEAIDQMAALRRQGLPFRDIGARVGCSERTARRYAGIVQPQLQLPEANPGPKADPRQLREDLISEMIGWLYNNQRLRSSTMTWRRADERTEEAVRGGPPSILFLSEAERLLRERMDQLGPLALKFLAQDVRSKRRFLREVVGFLYWDYVHWHEFSQNFPSSPNSTGEDWLPPGERPPSKTFRR